MISRLVIPAVVVLVIGVASATQSGTQGFEARQICDRVFAIADSVTGEEQVVIESTKGLIVLNSFWSRTTAQRFKAAIVEELKRDDFLCLIDMVDRLDLFGGNAAYEGIPIIGQEAVRDKYLGKEDAARAEVDRLIEMWRWKEGVARERMTGHVPGSQDAVIEQRWINTCKNRADDLETGFSLVLPTEVYADRKTLDAGDLTLNLIWFGKAGYNGMTVIEIPELQLAVFPGFILHSQHLAPYPQPEFARLDVPRWIEIMGAMLEGDKPVSNILCGVNSSDMWTKERALAHLRYIRELWNAVAEAEAAGRDLPEIQEELSLDRTFAFVKEMRAYLDNGDDWIRPQHRMHVRLFFLQHKKPASEIMMSLGLDSLTEALARIRAIRDRGEDIYFEESSINGIGYALLGMGKPAEAVEVLRLNVEVFPESSNAYDSYAEALMKNGDNEAAITNYKKSLALNPQNENARNMLKTLEDL